MPPMIVMKRRKDGVYVKSHEEDVDIEEQPAKERNNKWSRDLLPVQKNFYSYGLDPQTQIIINDLRTGFKIGSDLAEEVIQFFKRIGIR